MIDLSYEEWTDVLYQHFFNEGQTGQEILLAVDSQIFTDLFPSDSENAQSNFISAVSDAINGNEWRVEKIDGRRKYWEMKGSEGPHPALPFLALTVLAASNMGDAGLSPLHYYGPLRKLIDPSDESHGSPGPRGSGFVDYIEILWLSVEEWSRTVLEGKFGILRAKSGGQNNRYVFLAQQHSFLRTSDLRHLDKYFQRLDLEPGEKHGMELPQLRRSVGVWANSQNGPWADRLVAACEERDESEKELEVRCERILDRYSLNWDGRPRNPRTNRVYGRIRMSFNVSQPMQPFFNFEWEEGFRLEGRQKTLQGDGLVFLYEEGDRYYKKPGDLSIEEIPNESELKRRTLESVLNEGMEVATDFETFYFPPRSAYVFEWSGSQWTSADRVDLDEMFYLLVPKDRSEMLMSFISGLMDEDSRDLEVVSAPLVAIPESWALIKYCRIDKPAKGKIPDELAEYMPSNFGLRLSLRGGLRIGIEESRITYIRGGEPTCIPNSLADRQEKVILSGENGEKLLELEMEDNETEIQLWKYSLVPGRYTLSHSGSNANFEIAEGIAEFYGKEAGTVGCDGLMVSGTDVDETVRTEESEKFLYTMPVPKECGEEPNPKRRYPTVLLGVDSSQYSEFYYPSWVRQMLREIDEEPFLSFMNTDVWVDFEPTWAITQEKSLLIATMINSLPCSEIWSESSAGSNWWRTIDTATLDPDSSSDVKELWESYKEIGDRIE